MPTNWKSPIQSCTRCPLHHHQPPLVDTQNSADVIAVGLSAKFFSSDQHSITPFDASTLSGKLFQELEDSCSGFTFYKTNLVKCAPLDKTGKLRYPLSKEKHDCFSHFLLEMEVLSPSHVLLFGRVVADFVLPKLGLDKQSLPKNYQYNKQKYKDTHIVAVHHPSYIQVYKRKEKERYIQAIKKSLFCV